MSAPVSLMTASRARVARSCRRRHHLEYHLGYRPTESGHSLRFGQLVHEGLEAWWLAAKAKRPQDEWLAEAMRALTEREADELDLAHAQVLLMAYHLRWKDEPYEVLAVEARFEGPLINPKTGAESRNWRLGGKLDVLVRDRRTGEPVVIEHKTSSEDVSPGSTYWSRLRMDGQVSIYWVGASFLGQRVERVVYDVLSKPQHELKAVPVVDEHGNKVVHDANGERVRTAQGKWRQTGDAAQGFILQTRPETLDEHKLRLVEEIGKAPERWLSRGDVVRLDAEMFEAMQDVWHLAQSLRDEERLGRFPRNPDACCQPGRVCPFFSVCTGEASLEDERRFVRNTDVHPELAGAVVNPQNESKEETHASAEVAVQPHPASVAHDVVQPGEGAPATADSSAHLRP